MTEPGRPITYGVVKPGPEDSDRGILFVRGGDIRDGKIALGGLRTITEDVSRPYARTLLKGGELLISLVGNPGEVAIAPEALVGANIARQVGLIALRTEFDARYVMYFLRSPAGRAGLFERTQGAVQQVINLAALKTIRVSLPELQEQRRIAATLSAYDDLIENGRRRIALLEEAARNLYKEWFVRFRFPGHEHVKVINGVPEGWRRTSASDVMNILSGGTPKTTTPKFWDGEIGLFTPKDSVPACYVSATEKTITEEGLANCNSKLYPKDTLFITARGTVGKMNLALVPMAMNQSCYALVSKSSMSQRLLYLTIDASLQQLRSQASGAVFDAIVVATFDRILVTSPDTKTADAFDELVKPIFDLIANLVRQNEQLTKARDILLPKLMSGAIPV